MVSPQYEIRYSDEKVTAWGGMWEQTIVSPYTATISDAFIGIERLKLANEGAIRESIKSGIEHISTTSFK